MSLDLTNLPIDELQNELERRKAKIEELRALQADLEGQRDDLIQRIAETIDEINDLGAETGLASITKAIGGKAAAKAPAKKVSKKKVSKKKVAKKAAKKVVKKAAKKSAKPAAKKVSKAAGKRGRKGGGDAGGSLTDVVASVLDKKKPKRIPEIIEAVLATGYKTKSSNFRTIINQTLAGKKFKKAGRGLYLLK